MKQNISAWTGRSENANEQVPFISVNRTGEYQENVEISVRQNGDSRTAPYATIVMTKEEFALFLVQAIQRL